MRAFCLLLLSLKLDQLSLLKHNYFFVGGEGGWVNGCKDDTGTNEAMDDSERNRLGSKLRKYKSLISWIWIFFSFNASVYDGAWHHLCFTWENTYGQLKLYKNGQFEGQHMGFQVGYTVRSGGHLVLGQDQDTVGGGFTLEDTLNAQLAEVNMWDRVLSGKEIAAQYTNCRIPSGSVVTWSEFKTLTHGSVIVKHWRTITSCSMNETLNQKSDMPGVILVFIVSLRCWLDSRVYLHQTFSRVRIIKSKYSLLFSEGIVI